MECFIYLFWWSFHSDDDRLLSYIMKLSSICIHLENFETVAATDLYRIFIIDQWLLLFFRCTLLLLYN